MKTEVSQLNNKLKIICSMVLLLLFIYPVAYADEYQVNHAGALKNFMRSGDISAKFSLQDLKGKKGLYALGAFENLKGEIQIFDSVPYNSFVSGGRLAFDLSFKKKASLLVYAQVQSWQELSIPESVSSHNQFENFIAEIAIQRGVIIDEPFPFLITGKAKQIAWHVIDWNKNDKIHTHRKHIESGLNGNLENINVTILGFYSSKHKAIFTHHSTNIHMHFKTEGNTIAGHIDKFIPGRGMHLKLPAIK